MSSWMSRLQNDKDEKIQVRTYQAGLQTIRQTHSFTDKQKRLCAAMCREAFERGREWRAGDEYPLVGDSLYMDFKGNDHDSDAAPWKKDVFEKAFNEQTTKTLCAFINTFLYHEKRPLVPARVVFGVTNSGQMHGVTLTLDRMPRAFDDIANTFAQQIRTQLRDGLRDINNLSGKIMDALRIDIKQIGPSARLFDHVIIQAVVSVELDFNHDNMQVLSPACIVQDGKNWVYIRHGKGTVGMVGPHRHGNSGFRTATRDECAKLHALGLPINAKYETI